MKLLISLAAILSLFFLATSSVQAAPFNAENNPQIVANYPSGLHGVAGEPETHEGADVVMRAGDSGNFQQWFYGTSTEAGGITEGDHSVWKESKDGTCKDNETLVPDAYPEWGTYLAPNTDYCVKTNDFRAEKHSE